MPSRLKPCDPEISSKAFIDTGFSCLSVTRFTCNSKYTINHKSSIQILNRPQHHEAIAHINQAHFPHISHIENGPLRIKFHTITWQSLQGVGNLSSAMEFPKQYSIAVQKHKMPNLRFTKRSIYVIKIHILFLSKTWWMIIFLEPFILQDLWDCDSLQRNTHSLKDHKIQYKAPRETEKIRGMQGINWSNKIWS